MTTQRSFKRLVRARMEKTGESYMAARAMLLAADDEATEKGRRVLSTSDEEIRRRTGRGWEEWFDLLDDWGAAERTHRETARWVAAQQGVDPVDQEGVVGVGRALDGAHGARLAGAERQLDGVELDAGRQRAAEDGLELVHDVGLAGHRDAGDARGGQGLDERPARPVAARGLGGVDLDEAVVDAEPGQGRQHVLHQPHLGGGLPEGGAPSGAGDLADVGGQAGGALQVGAHENDPAGRRGR
jgi:hypothetical protein